MPKPKHGPRPGLAITRRAKTETEAEEFERWKRDFARSASGDGVKEVQHQPSLSVVPLRCGNPHCRQWMTEESRKWGKCYECGTPVNGERKPISKEG